MKFLSVVLAVFGFSIAVLASAEDRPQTRLVFTYEVGATGAYPVGTTFIYSPGTVVDYVAGAVVTYLYKTSIKFNEDTEFYTSSGPVFKSAGSVHTFDANSQVTYGPGSSVEYVTQGETRYGQFNGNTHAIATYPNRTSVQYYYNNAGNSNLILYSATSNPLEYYNPGGSTRFGASALPVQPDPATLSASRTYGGGYYGYNSYGSRGGSYSYCSGYSNSGWPTTTYYNRNYGYTSCRQTCYNCYSYSTYSSTAGGGMYGK